MEKLDLNGLAARVKLADGFKAYQTPESWTVDHARAL
jgi:hypothetical protein